MKKELTKAYIALGIVSFFWGTTYIASRIATREMPGLFVAGLRQVTAGLMLVGYFLIKKYPLPSRSDFKKITIQGILMLSIANGILTWSLQYVNSGLDSIIAGLVPLFVALFSVLMLKHIRFTKWMLIGLITGFLGIVVIFYEYLDQLVIPTFAFGVSLAFISTISWSVGTVHTSRYQLSLNILYATGWQMLIAGTIIIPICFITGQYSNPFHASNSLWYSLVYLVLFGSLLAYSAYVFAISKLPPTLVSIYAYINPIVAVTLGWLLLHEKMTFNVVTGTVITLAGVYLVNREFRKQKSKVKDTVLSLQGGEILSNNKKTSLWNLLRK